MQYDDKVLEALLRDSESTLVERKESWSGDSPDKGRQAVCAFANDLPGYGKPGVLFVGARDDGSAAALTVSDELLCTLADMKTDGNILPPPVLSVEKRILNGSEVAVVTVQPADSPPVRYKGRIWVRTGPRRSLASQQEERILNEKRRYKDQPYDIHPIRSSGLKDINRLRFEEEYLPNAFAEDVLAANDRSYEDRLAACKMIVSAQDPAPTLLGILLLGKAPLDWVPGNFIQFLRIDGTDLSDPIVDESRIEGTIGQILRRIDEKLESHNRTAVDITSASLESRVSPYPQAALQQLVRNAVMHRTYENTHAPVRVVWFADRIEIMNPGGPYGQVTRENFGRVVDYRNPNLADAMKVLGFVQRFGVGLQIVRKKLEENGNPPAEFLVEPSTILATVRKRP